MSKDNIAKGQWYDQLQDSDDNLDPPTLDSPVSQPRLISRSDSHIDQMSLQRRNFRNQIQSFRNSGYEHFDYFHNEESDASKFSHPSQNTDFIQKFEEDDSKAESSVSWFYSVVILIVNLGWVGLGTWIFMYYENKGRARKNAEAYEMLVHFRGHINNATVILGKLLELQQQMCRKNNDRVGDDWAFWGSFQYCNSVITTLGYGLVYPHTALAKYITMIYGVIGIPIYLLYLSHFHTYLTTILASLETIVQTSLRLKWMCKSVIRLALFRFVVISLVMWSFIAFHLWLVFPPVKSWNDGHWKYNALSMVYWQTIRFTTIGFGDIVILINHDTTKLLSNTMILLPLGICYMNILYEFYRAVMGKGKISSAICYRTRWGRGVCCANQKSAKAHQQLNQIS